MASFGFSIGDIILVSNYAYSVYKSCKNAGDNFREISSDVNSLRTLLLALDNECKNPQSSFQELAPAQKGELAARLQDCKADLRSVKMILHDFRSLDTRDARYRDKLAFTTGKQTAIREKIETHSVRLQRLLNGINVGTFSRIERNTKAHHLSLLDIRAKLDRIHMDILAGKRDATTFMNSEDAVALEDEVLDDHMTEVDVDVSYEVHTWVEQVRMERSQAHDDEIGSFEPHARVHSSRNSPEILGVEHTRNTEAFEPSSRIREGDSYLSDDKTGINEQSSQFEDVRKHLKAPRASEGSATPHLSNTPRKPRDSISSTSINSSKIAVHGRTLIDLRRCQWSVFAPTVYDELYRFDEQEKCWVKQTHRNKTSTVQISSGILQTVDLTLEEVFTGTVKYFTLRRRTVRSETDHSTSFEDINLDLQIKQGVLQNDKIRYTVRTNLSQKHDKTVSFRIRRKPHELFEDAAANLVHKIHPSVTEAKEGWKREIQHLNGKVILVHADGPTTYRHILALDGQGLPYSERPSKRGALIFQIGHQCPPYSSGWGRKTRDKKGFRAQLDEPNAAAVFSTTHPHFHHFAILASPRKRANPDISTTEV